MSASREPNMREPNIYDVDVTPEAVLLPPPPRAQKSVLRSLEALDAAEKAGVGGRSARMGDQASAPIIIDAKAETPRAPQMKPQPAPAVSPEPRAARAPQSPRAEEPVQPMRASAFRPKAVAVGMSGSHSPWIMRAAAATVLVAAGWIGANQLLSNGLALTSPGSTMAKLSPLEQVQRDMQAMTAEMAALRERMTKSDPADMQNRIVAENDALKKTILDLSRRVEQLRTAQTASATELGARIERVRADDGRGREEIIERLTRLERQTSDNRPSASLPQAQIPQHALPQLPALPAGTTGNSVMPRASAQPPAPGDADQRRAGPLAGFVLHEVQNGVALIEGRSGFIEAYPGANIPGAGRVQSIVRRGGAWVVVTSNGVIAQKFN